MATLRDMLRAALWDTDQQLDGSWTDCPEYADVMAAAVLAVLERRAVEVIGRDGLRRNRAVPLD